MNTFFASPVVVHAFIPDHTRGGPLPKENVVGVADNFLSFTNMFTKVPIKRNQFTANI